MCGEAKFEGAILGEQDRGYEGVRLSRLSSLIGKMPEFVRVSPADFMALSDHGSLDAYMAMVERVNAGVLQVWGAVFDGVQCVRDCSRATVEVEERVVDDEAVSIPDNDSVPELVPSEVQVADVASYGNGGCYLWFFRPERVATVWELLGEWPALRQVLSLPLNWFRSAVDLNGFGWLINDGKIHVYRGRVENDASLAALFKVWIDGVPERDKLAPLLVGGVMVCVDVEKHTTPLLDKSVLQISQVGVDDVGFEVGDCIVVFSASDQLMVELAVAGADHAPNVVMSDSLNGVSVDGRMFLVGGGVYGTKSMASLIHATELLPYAMGRMLHVIVEGGEEKAIFSLTVANGVGMLAALRRFVQGFGYAVALHESVEGGRGGAGFRESVKKRGLRLHDFVRR